MNTTTTDPIDAALDRIYDRKTAGHNAEPIATVLNRVAANVADLKAIGCNCCTPESN